MLLKSFTLRHNKKSWQLNRTWLVRRRSEGWYQYTRTNPSNCSTAHEFRIRWEHRLRTTLVHPTEMNFARKSEISSSRSVTQVSTRRVNAWIDRRRRTKSGASRSKVWICARVYLVPVSYVVVSTLVVLPRGACSRRRAVPDWTSLGPWSREGRSRFTSASPASFHRSTAALGFSPPLSRSCVSCEVLPLSLSPGAFVCRAVENAAVYLSVPLSSTATSRDISGSSGKETER